MRETQLPVEERGGQTEHNSVLPRTLFVLEAESSFWKACVTAVRMKRPV